MGRRAEGWKVRYKRGWAYVCFTHEAREHRIALGTRDPGEAAKAAPLEYAAVVSGARRATAARPSTLLGLDELMAEYVASLVGSLDPETIETREGYARKFIAFFGDLARMTEGTIGDYQRARLRQVLRKTVMKERGALVDFFRWCTEQGILAVAPKMPDLPRKATGVRAGKQRAKPVHITLEQAAGIIAALPEWSKRIGGRKWPVRARYEVAWETGLRPETLATLCAPDHYRPGAPELRIDDENDKVRFGRTVPLSEAACAALEAVAPEKGLIFGRHEFSKVLKRAAAEVLGVDVAKAFAQYDFRHGRTTQLLEETGNLPGVGYLVGHRRGTTTDKYTHGTQRAAARVIGAVSGPIPGRGVGGGRETWGDRRVSNPRQLEPQRSLVAKSVVNSHMSPGLPGAESGAPGPYSRTGSGNALAAAARGIAVQRVEWDLFEAFAEDAEEVAS